MPDYTELKGLNNLSETQPLTMVGPNLVMFFDWGFVNKGGYNNVRLNQSDVNGGDRSKFQLVRDPNYVDGRVWQAPVRNLVWESGVSIGSPVAISGVYVNGTFRPSNITGTYAHQIDYSNGRVIFNSPIATTSTVKMEYAYKNIDIKEANASPLMQYIQNNSFNITTPQYLANSGDWSILSPNKIQLPHVAFEVGYRVQSSPVELGSYNEYVLVDVLANVFTSDPVTGKNLASIIRSQKDKTIYMLDVDKIALNNDFPLNYQGYKKTSPKTYPQLVGEDGSQYRKTKLTFRDAFISSNGLINYNFKNVIDSSLHHTVIRLTVEILQTF